MYSKNIKSFPNVHLFKITLYHMMNIFDIRQKKSFIFYMITYLLKIIYNT